MITPSDIENKDFARVKKGYSMEEVDDFLDLIIVDMENLLRENRQLKEQIQRVNAQADKQISTETSVYETLEAAKSLMNDIAASAERRAEVLLKNAELEANVITREARESIARLTEESNRLRGRVDALKARYKTMLEVELQRLDFMGNDILEELENDFLPASMADADATIVNVKDDGFDQKQSAGGDDESAGKHSVSDRTIVASEPLFAEKTGVDKQNERKSADDDAEKKRIREELSRTIVHISKEK